MGAKTQEPLRPMVLLFNCPNMSIITELQLGGVTPATDYIGHQPDFYNIELPDVPWWVDPALRGVDDLSDSYGWRRLLYQVHDGNMSPRALLLWLETEEFVKAARREINQAIRRALGLKAGSGFDPRWHEAVRLVVLNARLGPSSDWVRRVFDGYFRGAQGKNWVFYEPHAKGAQLKPIWRDAEVTELKREPAIAEVLDWPISQLPSRLSGEAMTLVQESLDHPRTIRILVRLSRNTHRRRGHFSDNVLDGLDEALAEHGLWLGMTEQDIEAWKLGLPRGTQLTTPADIRADTRRQRSSG